MNATQLLEAGFKEHPVPHLKRSNRFFQKCIRDARGKRFYVNIEFWQHSNYSDMRDSWSSDVQFTQGDDTTTFNVALFVRDEDTPESIVDWYETLWRALGCDYYELSETGGRGK